MVDFYKEKTDFMKKEIGEIKKQIRQQTLGYILAGFGLVAGLAWNEAIKDFIEYIFPLQQNSLLAKFIYAILLTILFVVISMYIVRISKNDESS